MIFTMIYNDIIYICYKYICNEVKYCKQILITKINVLVIISDNTL